MFKLLYVYHCESFWIAEINFEYIMWWHPPSRTNIMQCPAKCSLMFIGILIEKICALTREPPCHGIIGILVNPALIKSHCFSSHGSILCTIKIEQFTDITTFYSRIEN
jgi:hypothetical protein